jgi:dynein heavy chain
MVPLTKQNLYEKFLSRVQSNLHLVLAFSPMGNTFRTRLINFPSLVTCCPIDWFTEWPAEALRGVANEVFADVEFTDLIVSDGIVSLCRDIHLGVEKASAVNQHVTKKRSGALTTLHRPVTWNF